ncbi:MAG: hypothetical protein R3A10_15575 [Caldilineaceae bacterium]
MVNDLDLEVTSPAGVTYVGNVFANGWSQTGEKPDRVNNVENVFVPSAAAEWTVTVAASTCHRAASPRWWSTARWRNRSKGARWTSRRPWPSPRPRTDDEVAGTVSIGAEATDDSGVAGSSSTSTAVCSRWTPPSPYVVNWNSTSAVNGRHKLRVRAIDTADQTAEAEVTVRLANPLPDRAAHREHHRPRPRAVVDEDRDHRRQRRG